MIKLSFILLLIMNGVGCTPLKPWQRGNLALPQMALTPDPLEFGLRQHAAFSKESTSGGYGGSGGGCGCN